MSATEQMRAMLDGLMGTARDGSDAKRQHLHFTDPKVCRAFLLDCCPHDIFASTKLEMGECPKVHDHALRADYILANKTEDYMYEVSALERLQAFVNDADRKTDYLKRKLAETQEELTSEETNKLNRVHDLTEKLGKKLAQVDKAEADGDMELKQKYLDESEKIKKERATAEAEYRQVSRPASSHQQQNLRVCDVCSAYLGINDNDSRLADHFGGKLHLGFIEVREKLEDLKKRCADKGRSNDSVYSKDRHYRDRGGERDRDRGRDRERDRDRDRPREDKYRDIERDRSRSSSRYYHRDARYDSRSRDSPRDYQPRHRDQVSRDRSLRYRDDRIERDRSDRIDRSEHRHGSSVAVQPPSRSSRGPFDRSSSINRHDERESSYQRKLREWEKRETDKARSYAMRESEERERRMLEEQESKKLKEFFEDYKDDRDDIKFYRGSALARRLADRRKESELDEQARQKEKLELEMLSRSCAVGDHSTPQPIELAGISSDSNIANLTTTSTILTTAKLPAPAKTNAIATNGELAERFKATVHNESYSTSNTFTNNPSTASTAKASTSATTISTSNATNTTTTTNNTNAASNSQRPKVSTSEEKRKQVEELIGRIPTDKEQLFSRNLDWSLLDENLMERRIRPWVTKKIAEYMGEKEVELIDFVCTLLNDHKDGYSMLKEVAIVLDDEAEKFVVHMWRLLIFELEAKKIGLRR